MHNKALSMYFLPHINFQRFISATTKVILTTEEVITTTLKVTSANTKVLLKWLWSRLQRPR